MKLPSIREILTDISTQLSDLATRMTSVEHGLIFNINRLEKKIDTIDERTKSYPKLYENIDKLVGEIVENRQERVFMTRKLDNHEQRLGTLEKHFHNKI